VIAIRTVLPKVSRDAVLQRLPEQIQVAEIFWEDEEGLSQLLSAFTPSLQFRLTVVTPETIEMTLLQNCDEQLTVRAVLVSNGSSHFSLFPESH
jgi:hypothetical protein